MFDRETAELLRSAPEVPGLNPQDLPALLTRHYAELVSARLRGTPEELAAVSEEWSPERIADTYELIASLQSEGRQRRAAAFVAGTAQQIVARKQLAQGREGPQLPNIDQNRVDPTIAAAVLFLASEQYADAHEAANAIDPRRGGQGYEAAVLAEDIADLARGRLLKILERSNARRRPPGFRSMEELALAGLLQMLINGMRSLAAQFLGREPPDGASVEGTRAAFDFVRALTAPFVGRGMEQIGDGILDAYSGPHHLAKLLMAGYDGLRDAGLISLPPPDGADPDFWQRWLTFRAGIFPFVWPNHREAIAKQFHQTKKSAVVVLPTGAGKTTVSSLKIAGVLARGKKVVFLAPTHALSEQLTEDLQQMFPQDILGSVVSSDFDQLLQSDAQLKEIEVMTPERCLAMLSFAPDAFAEVGLLVFDECHLLSPEAGKMRRAVDGMLCVLAFNHVAPEADFLFLSAMLKEAQIFADWVGQLTSRECVCVDLQWKPSRQARGVVIYKSEEITRAEAAALNVQNAENSRQGKFAKGLRAGAARELAVQPYAIWGLQHNWLGDRVAQCIFAPVLHERVPLSGIYRPGWIRSNPNANQVAIRIAVSAAKNGLKTIIFVNTKNDAVSVANDIAEELGQEISASEFEESFWNALEAELGGLKHALLPRPAAAVPHNSAMLTLERRLAENMFRRDSGAKVIVATPTLAQGLNLPAQLAILAGDKRADANQKGREDLKAHEILNAAARAGRAGHLANGVVLLIPEPIIKFSEDRSLDGNVIQKLQSVLPEDDRCVVISDPLEVVLDRLMQGQSADADVRYMVNRLAALGEAEGLEDPNQLFNLRKSLGAYAAKQRNAEAVFESKIAELRKAVTLDQAGGVDNTTAVLASRSGLSMDVLSRLKAKIIADAGSLPTTVESWLGWTIDWLAQDDVARDQLLSDVKRSILGACGKKRDGELTVDALYGIAPGLFAWIQGKPLADIEELLGGNPQSTKYAERICPRARELVGNVIQRGFSFLMSLVSHVVEEVNPFDKQEHLDRNLVECLGTALRKGYDSPQLVQFANDHKEVLSRVQMHQDWRSYFETIFEDLP